MLRALRSESCDLSHETLLKNHTRDRGHDLLWALGSASCEITHETGNTICSGHWVLYLVNITDETGGYDLLLALGSASCESTHGTVGTVCCGC